MKLAVIGGAGVRAPLLMPALASRQEALDLTEVVLMDTDEDKLAMIAAICQYAAERQGARFVVRPTLSAREALTGAEAVITTIRVGTEDSRVKDERIALEHGVLGQETTGPGGFAMALRSIPVVAGYARMMEELCPRAWLMNFTNPAGMVVQALTGEFPDLKISGICDTPSSMHRQVATAFGRNARDMPIRLFGLNHLSWLAEASIDGKNVVPRLISDPELYRRISDLLLFEPDLVRMLGMVPNEYLYFYYYRDQAVANIQAAVETRGEQVRRLSGELLDDLAAIDPEANPQRAYRRYRRYLGSRHGTYLAIETGGQEAQAWPQTDDESEEETPDGGEGYAGVALDILVAARADRLHRVVANVPNHGAIPGMADDDVVETVCEVRPDGLETVPAGDVPEDCLLLMQNVKRYERLTVDAIRERSRDLAVEALMVHPLVGSYPTAKGLVDAYLTAHAEHVGEWT